MKLFDQEQAIRKQIFEYFGYKEDWRILPLEDCRDVEWRIISNGGGWTVQCLQNGGVFGNEDDEDCFEYEIYTQRFLDKWVYRGEEFTMILVDTHTDGNQFLSIFTNSKEVK